MCAHASVEDEGVEPGECLGAVRLCGTAEVGELGGVNAGDADVDLYFEGEKKKVN